MQLLAHSPEAPSLPWGRAWQWPEPAEAPAAAKLAAAEAELAAADAELAASEAELAAAEAELEANPEAFSQDPGGEAGHESLP